MNAKMILPENLLKELQRYVQGEIIYVPGNGLIRAGWGENNGTRANYSIRNHEISVLYEEGLSTAELAERFHLSEYSIKKIISSCKKHASLIK
jgi:Mor family transcriptional regulator